MRVYGVRLWREVCTLNGLGTSEEIVGRREWARAKQKRRLATVGAWKWREGGHQQHGDADLQKDPDNYDDVTAEGDMISTPWQRVG